MTEMGGRTCCNSRRGGLATVSAVIPAYNAAATIERALRSVYAQTYPNIIEVIVVDDGSTDGTAQIVRDKFPNVTLIRQENRGVGGARNRGLQAVQGEYIALLDADDEWMPWHVEDLAQVAQMFPEAGLLATGYCFRPDERVEVVYTHVSDRPVRADWFSIQQRLWVANMSSIAVRRADVLAIGGFREDMPPREDIEFLARISLRTGFVFHPRVSAVYYGGIPGSATAVSRDMPGSRRLFQSLEEELLEGRVPEDKRAALMQLLATVLLEHCRWCLERGRRAEARQILTHPVLREDPSRILSRMVAWAALPLPCFVIRWYFRFRQSRWGTPRRVVAEGFVRTVKSRETALA